jgi:hypothetical protein
MIEQRARRIMDILTLKAFANSSPGLGLGNPGITGAY